MSDIQYLRKLSRQEYLMQREKRKIDELRDEITDDQFLVHGVKLSKTEHRQQAYKNQLYKIMQSRKAEDDRIGYQIPEAYDYLRGGTVNQGKRFSVALKQRYSEGVHDAWIEHQISNSSLNFGSFSRKLGFESDYEFVFEDQNETRVIVDDNIREEKLRSGSKLKEDRKSLPIHSYRGELLKAINDHQILIIVGETGSGKTTQIPQYLHEAGFTEHGIIGCTQPRRLAAMSVASRVSKEMRVKLGREVGYSIRFEDCSSKKTVIKYMTDGMMLREFAGEPDLGSYSVIMIDEAHERTFSTDILFGLLKDLARFRPNLKLLISSATLDAEKFSDYFDSAPIFKIPGRRFPVETNYATSPPADYLDAAISTVLQIHKTQGPGDILLFLTGQEEIENVEEILKEKTRGLGTKIGELIICPIFSNLPTELQAKIFEATPRGARKVVLATNIAETSVTIDGIRYVIDPGFSKIKSYNPRLGMESLLVSRISKASANQRAGRAGRTGPGKCYRFYTSSTYEQDMEDNTVPEIQRTNLANVVLTLKGLGVRDLHRFDFMDPPPSEALIRALELLYALGALNKSGNLTKVGRRMAEFPLDPMLSKAIVASEKYNCSEEIITIAAMLSLGNSVFYRPKGKRYHADAARMRFHEGGAGDHIALLKVYNEWKMCNYSRSWCYENYVQFKSMKRARDTRDQLEGLLQRVEIEMKSSINDLEAIKKSLTAGYFPHCARLQQSGSYLTLKDAQTVSIHPSSGLAQTDPQPRWLVYHELVKTTNEFMRQVTEVKSEWLIEIAPHYYQLKDVDYVATKKMLRERGQVSSVSF